jgi:hypothetical protein
MYCKGLGMIVFLKTEQLISARLRPLLPTPLYRASSAGSPAAHLTSHFLLSRLLAAQLRLKPHHLFSPAAFSDSISPLFALRPFLKRLFTFKQHYLQQAQGARSSR